MSNPTTIEGVIGNFQHYDSIVQFNREEIAVELKQSIIREIIRSRSIDTGAFILAVDYEQTRVDSTFAGYVIDTSANSDVFYDAIVELGRNDVNYPGRYNYQKGIQNANFEQFFDEWFDLAFIF